MIAAHLPVHPAGAQSETGEGLRGHHQLSARLPLRRIRHAARASDRSCFMTLETELLQIETARGFPASLDMHTDVVSPPGAVKNEVNHL